MPIFSAARVVALMHGVEARTTPEAARCCTRTGDGCRKETSTISSRRTRILLNLILGQQFRDIDAGVALSNKVAPSELNGFEKQELKWALNQVPLVSNLLGVPVLGR